MKNRKFRLEKAFEHLRYIGEVQTKKSFAQILGVNYSNLSSAFNGEERYLTDNLFQRISDKFPIFNLNWLLTEDGEMLNDDNSESKNNTLKDAELVEVEEVDTTPAKQEKEFRSYFKKDKVVMVPLYNMDSVGGFDSENQVLPSEEEYVEEYVPFLNALPDDFACHASGDSMLPRIPSGSILLLRCVPDWREYFGLGHVYVLLLRDGRRITKRITRSEVDPQKYVLCESYNPDYPSEELPKSMILRVWKVVDMLIHEGF